MLYESYATIYFTRYRTSHYTGYHTWNSCYYIGTITRFIWEKYLFTDCILSNEAIPHLQNKSQVFNSAQFEKMCLPEYQKCICFYMLAYCSNLVGLSMHWNPALDHVIKNRKILIWICPMYYLTVRIFTNANQAWFKLGLLFTWWLEYIKI